MDVIKTEPEMNFFKHIEKDFCIRFIFEVLYELIKIQFLLIKTLCPNQLKYIGLYDDIGCLKEKFEEVFAK